MPKAPYYFRIWGVHMFVLGSWARAFVPALLTHDKARRLAGAVSFNTGTLRCVDLEATLHGAVLRRISLYVVAQCGADPG